MSLLGPMLQDQLPCEHSLDCCVFFRMLVLGLLRTNCLRILNLNAVQVTERLLYSQYSWVTGLSRLNKTSLPLVPISYYSITYISGKPPSSDIQLGPNDTCILHSRFTSLKSLFVGRVLRKQSFEMSVFFKVRFPDECYMYLISALINTLYDP